METIIFYDVETSEMIKWNFPSDHKDQPRVTQIAAELCIEETGETIGAMNMIIRPDGWVISQECQDLTGITMERAERFGVPSSHAINGFIELWINADNRCGHNESFDARMIRIEIMRHAQLSMETMSSDDKGQIPFADYWKEAPAYCTMHNSTAIVKIPQVGKKSGFKFPKLGEAYKHFTGLELIGAHNAQVDIMACKAIYYGLRAHNAAA